MADLAFRVQHVIKTEIDVTQAQLSRNGIEVLTGAASFLDPHARARDELARAVRYRSAHIIIATGTKPAVSPKVPLNGRNIINSDQILSMPEIPKTLIVVGGGVIGVEYTCMFATLGVRVILIEKRPRLLEFADSEMVEALSYHLRDSRVTMRLNEEVESVEEMPDGGVVANLQSKKRISGDALLYAVGRQGNVDELNLAGGRASKPTIAGRIPVDDELPHQAAEHLRGRRRHRVSQPGFGVDGAGPHRGGATPSACRCTRIPPTIRTASTPSRRSPSSARPRSS